MRKRMVKVGFAVLLLMLPAFAYWTAEPCAVLVQVSGGVQLQRAGQPTLAAAVGLTLLPGDKVMIAAGAKAVLLYKTGKMQAITQTFTVEGAQRDKPGGLFSQTIATLAQVATTNARTQPNRQGMIRPIEGTPAPISPRNEVKVAELHPVFTWFKLPDATSYLLQIRCVDPIAGRPERFNLGNDTTWAYPSDATPLIPGALYEWTVGSSTGRAADPQRFRIMSSDDLARVAGTMNELISNGIDPLGDGLLLTALAYHDAGLMYDANRMLDRMQANGAKGRAYYLLRGEVYDALGNLDAAAKAFAAADAEPKI